MTAEKTCEQHSERGFKNLEPIAGSYGGEVEVCESSAAEHPHIWLHSTGAENLIRPDLGKTETLLHLTVEDARKLAEQLLFLVSNHYQVEPLTPDQMQDGKRYRVVFEGTKYDHALLTEIGEEMRALPMQLLPGASRIVAIGGDS